MIERDARAMRMLWKQPSRSRDGDVLRLSDSEIACEGVIIAREVNVTVTMTG